MTEIVEKKKPGRKPKYETEEERKIALRKQKLKWKNNNKDRLHEYYLENKEDIMNRTRLRRQKIKMEKIIIKTI
jgi:hypothetical protein